MCLRVNRKMKIRRPWLEFCWDELTNSLMLITSGGCVQNQHIYFLIIWEECYSIYWLNIYLIHFDYHLNFELFEHCTCYRTDTSLFTLLTFLRRKKKPTKISNITICKLYIIIIYVCTTIYLESRVIGPRYPKLYQDI